MTLEVGQRVRIKPSAADGYVQPWRSRIERGLFGVVEGRSNWGYDIRFDVPKRVKYPHDWYWRGVVDRDVEPVADEWKASDGRERVAGKSSDRPLHHRNPRPRDATRRD